MPFFITTRRGVSKQRDIYTARRDLADTNGAGTEGLWSSGAHS